MLNDENVSLPELPLFDGVGLSNIVVTCDEVESVRKALPIGKATGPDGINNCILRELAHELSPPLCSLFNQSLILGIVPDIWKEAHVCPVPKGGDRTAVLYYRPISLLSSINKVLERIVFKHLYNHFLENDILTPLQSGFIPGDSTVNQLLFLYNAFCKALDAGKEVRVIFCDIIAFPTSIFIIFMIYFCSPNTISSFLKSSLLYGYHFMFEILNAMYV